MPCAQALLDVQPHLIQKGRLDIRDTITKAVNLVQLIPVYSLPSPPRFKALNYASSLHSHGSCGSRVHSAHARGRGLPEKTESAGL